MDIDEALKDAAFRRTGPLGGLVAEVARYQDELDETGTVEDPSGELDAAAAASFAWAMPYVSSLETAG